MSSVSRRVAIQTCEIAVPLPCAWGDLAGLVATALRAIGEDATQWDDAAEVVATENELFIRWEKP